MDQVIFKMMISFSFTSLDKYSTILVWVEIFKLSKHYFYFTQQGVYLSKLDALTKLTFGCILEQRYEYECAVELLLMNQVAGAAGTTCSGSSPGPVRRTTLHCSVVALRRPAVSPFLHSGQAQ